MPFDSINIESEVTTCLRRMLDYLQDEKRWRVGANADRHRRVCMVGAANMYADYVQQRRLNNQIIALLDATIPAQATVTDTNWNKRNKVKETNDINTHPIIVLWLNCAIEQSVANDAKQAVQ